MPERGWSLVLVRSQAGAWDREEGAEAQRRREEEGSDDK